ncbi:hypothetical protein CN141_20185 [Sinorhizobium meliloti]|nr:hypothetical protein CN141_20185 [Sinorhizobium meliloti]
MRIPVPLRGPASIPFRAFGIRPSRMNPNTCTICELERDAFRRNRKGDSFFCANQIHHSGR